MVLSLWYTVRLYREPYSLQRLAALDGGEECGSSDSPISFSSSMTSNRWLRAIRRVKMKQLSGTCWRELVIWMCAYCKCGRPWKLSIYLPFIHIPIFCLFVDSVFSLPPIASAASDALWQFHSEKWAIFLAFTPSFYVRHKIGRYCSIFWTDRRVQPYGRDQCIRLRAQKLTWSRSVTFLCFFTRFVAHINYCADEIYIYNYTFS